MDPEHLKELARIEQTYWWNVAKSELVRELLLRFLPPPGRLVEGGIGGGSNLLAFRQMGYEVLGLDGSEQSVAYGIERGLPARVHDLEQPWPLDPGGVKAVVLLDVLEHLVEPVMALKHAFELLEDDGGVVLTVPAYPALMGPWDEMVGHLRRYTRQSLLAQTSRAGLKPVWVSHWNAFTLPAAIAVRLGQRLFSRRHQAGFPSVPSAMNAALELAARLERRALARSPIPAGVSLVGVFAP